MARSRCGVKGSKKRHALVHYTTHLLNLGSGMQCFAGPTGPGRCCSCEVRDRVSSQYEVVVVVVVVVE